MRLMCGVLCVLFAAAPAAAQQPALANSANAMLPNPASNVVVLFFYGNGGTVAAEDPFERSVAALGPRVLAFDYRGYGFGTGTAEVLAMRRDALSEFDMAATLDALRALVDTVSARGS